MKKEEKVNKKKVKTLEETKKLIPISKALKQPSKFPFPLIPLPTS